MDDQHANCREPRKAGIHSWQETTLDEQRKNRFINNLQKPIKEFTGVTVNCFEINFNDEEWLRNIIRSHVALEELYQDTKNAIVSAVSTQHFGASIERDLLEQGFTAAINSPDKNTYLSGLSEAVRVMCDGYIINNSEDAQRAYNHLNAYREKVTEMAFNNIETTDSKSK